MRYAVNDENTAQLCWQCQNYTLHKQTQPVELQQTTTLA
jgi:hypothetical protein